ncbi:MAG: hypothetical protein COZ06_13610 [Armatimonadetes bacterium CG_4_10_14_3_um_filter_66_18]|nr:hypothetical protein [Armatimonadota bacterium]OIO96772.1 MAG: hypothetical protein AUJ96_24220 [Armatimonadetes bacterium CG2_30_66_41]PIU93846.1 MAG: hypothetical protein COS65_10645 [Armatimonadetes bacterium CG06_land_8_20_14_3_00_66_21]PIX36962.1 MAG: hypothetical protein COZ57_36865 [Armatimonadetes bacterium CG_4_8_14_3_um_filter_66_20]PIY49611.1 MAG: hypothetical protein COZ06_13610 [Armatimonadetes bacterium CG_4_10_14_3_um_filter_66_18]PIZ34136.1 MAG: hypothetical protein COY42_29
MSVAAVEVQRHVTAEGSWHMPDNGMWRELVKGAVVDRAPPGEEHGEVASGLHVRLGHSVLTHGLGRVHGDTGFLIQRDPDTVRAPDCAFRKARSLCWQGTGSRGRNSPQLPLHHVSERQLDQCLIRHVPLVTE